MRTGSPKGEIHSKRRGHAAVFGTRLTWRDVVEVDGRGQIEAGETLHLMLSNKPPGILSVFNDEALGQPGPETLITSNNRLYPVGRLDADSEGCCCSRTSNEMTRG